MKEKQLSPVKSSGVWNRHNFIFMMSMIQSKTGYLTHEELWGFPGGSDGEGSACDAGDLGLIPGLGRCPGEKNGYPLQYSCLENSTDRGAWWATVCVITESDMTEWLTLSVSLFMRAIKPQKRHGEIFNAWSKWKKSVFKGVILTTWRSATGKTMETIKIYHWLPGEREGEGWTGREQRMFKGSETIPYDTAMVETHHYIFAKTCKIHTKSEPWCKTINFGWQWHVSAGSLVVTYVSLWREGVGSGEAMWVWGQGVYIDCLCFLLILTLHPKTALKYKVQFKKIV